MVAVVLIKNSERAIWKLLK